MSSSPPHQVLATGGAIPGAGQGRQQLAISNGVLLAAVIFLFMVVVFVFLLYLYAKRYLGASPLMVPGTPSSSRFLFVDASPLAGRGLPAAVLRALPVTVYHHDSKQQQQQQQQGDGEGEALECAVCLSEVADGEKVRALPKCGHGFHVECIDMWFHSHDTCPLCRAPVEAALPSVPREDPAAALHDLPPVFPTNVLFWGTHDDVTNTGLAVPPPIAAAVASTSSSSASGRRKENLVIDIPSRPVAPVLTSSFSSPTTTTRTTTPLPQQSRMADDMRSPVSARLRSLRRLLSRGKQAVVGSSSPRSSVTAGDIEQGGFAGADRPPKTPKTPTN